MTSPHRAIYRRWRAQTFSELVGQTAVVTTLRNAVRRGRVPHAVLFVGPRGTGKTSTARILAKAINCPNVKDGEPCDVCPSCTAIRDGSATDVLETNAADNNRLEYIRDELIPRFITVPAVLRTKVFVVDEVQRYTDAWHVLLKWIEEPPDHVHFIFCTTDPTRIPATVISRVQRFDFRRLGVGEIEGKLNVILAADRRAAEPEAVQLIARLAAGGMRDAESILDQLLAYGEDTLTADQVREVLGLADQESVDRFTSALVVGTPLPALQVVADLEDRGRDLRAFLDQVIDAIRGGLTAALSGDARAAPGSLVAFGAEALGATARRLAEVDPGRGGPGGLRFQLELVALTGRHEADLRGSAGEATSYSPVMSSMAASKSSAPAATGATAGGTAVQPEATAPATARRPASSRPLARRPGVRAPGGGATPEPPTSDADVPLTAASHGNQTELLEELRRRWPDIVAVISRDPPCKPLIEACRPVSVEGDLVVLGFPEAQTFLRDAADRRRLIFETGLGEVLGRKVAVRCVATNLEAVPLPARGPLDDRLVAAARRIFADELAEVDEVG